MTSEPFFMYDGPCDERISELVTLSGVEVPVNLNFRLGQQYWGGGKGNPPASILFTGMKIFFSEYHTCYTTYTFSYAVYCIQEQVEEVPEIYARGFLPYTGDVALTSEIFYLARSLRMDLDRFTDTSENRRIDRKVRELNLEFSITEKSAFDINDSAFVEFCTTYAAERFSGGTMNEARLRYILGRKALTHILTFRSEKNVLGYVLACFHRNLLHYWYAFFDVAYLRTHSLGKWMMWKTLWWAREQKLKYVYLGTCYGKKALYKVRDHQGGEFFDGIRWNSDMGLLKHLCKTDDVRHQFPYDLLKSPENNEHLIFHSMIS